MPIYFHSFGGIFSRYTSRCEVAESKGKCIYSFVRLLPNSAPEGLYQFVLSQCKRMPVSPQPLIIFAHLICENYISVLLQFAFLNEYDRFSICLTALLYIFCEMSIHVFFPIFLLGFHSFVPQILSLLY